MLEIKNISKTYETEDLKQVALDNVSINFRSNEFASILGPSGSGKTTLLNIIGGLDHYDKGDLIINEVSTKKYNDRDWDSYRNHRIGFVFQSYNLINHQSILQNVELALTLSGVSSKERTKRAKQALKDVGLLEHRNKKPNQLSGGQMQRVAIARALVNNPDILLADEPTGALDSKTSEQIMELLKNVAKDKLVIMVTHNPDIAEAYSTRIIRLKDGKIIDDTDPYDGEENTKDTLEEQKNKEKRTSMSLTTALSLSLNNLLTKKGRTFLTAFAGSIGIIGIALILALSSGVQDYIDREQREALANYPLQINAINVDYTSMMGSFLNNDNITCEEGKICSKDDISSSPEVSASVSMTTNNLEKLKKYFDANGGNINDYVSDIKYIYDFDLQIYNSDTTSIVRVNPTTLSLSDTPSMMRVTSIADPFYELIDNEDLLKSQYEVLSGKLPSNYDEIVLIVDENYQVYASTLYSLDILDRDELTKLVSDIKDGNDVKLDTVNYNYDEFVGKTFKLLLNTDYYQKENGRWVDYSYDTTYLKKAIDNGLELKIVGVLKAKSESVSGGGYVWYTHDLTEYVINEVNKTAIAKEQLASPEINVFTGLPFDGVTASFSANAQTLALYDLDNPSGINIYPKDFEAKETIEDIISEYNNAQSDDADKITYTDLVGVLLSSVTSIVNVISYILIAFVAVSLVVSSIMIAIITYISVLERTKEIGILRAIGASKKDVSRVFNAETIIEGFVAGLLGVGIAYLLTMLVNVIVKGILDVENIAHLPVSAALILILISILLTVFAGLIPARMASKKDPVEALRSE